MDRFELDMDPINGNRAGVADRGAPPWRRAGVGGVGADDTGPRATRSACTRSSASRRSSSLPRSTFNTAQAARAAKTAATNAARLIRAPAIVASACRGQRGSETGGRLREHRAQPLARRLDLSLVAIDLIIPRMFRILKGCFRQRCYQPCRKE
jgi:hypothetical protein